MGPVPNGVILLIIGTGPPNPARPDPVCSHGWIGAFSFRRDYLGGMATRSDDTLNNYSIEGGRIGSVRERLGKVSKKTGKRGKSRFVIEFDSDPLFHDYDKIKANEGPAQAIAAYVRQRIRTNPKQVTEETYAARLRAIDAYKRGKLRKHYEGGQIGATPPKNTRRQLHFSGRLEQSIKARHNPNSSSGPQFTINVAANRMRPQFFRTMEAYRKFIGQLEARVPELRNPGEFGKVPEIRTAIVDAMWDGVEREEERGRGLSRQLRREQMNALRQGMGILRL